MGVRFLETFLEKHSDAAVNVNVKDLIRQHRESTGCTPVIVVDGYAILAYLYDGLSWLHGGQLLELRERLNFFIKEVKGAGGDLVMFMDGHCADYKLDVWIERGNRSVERLHNAIDDVLSFRVNIFDTMAAQNKVTNPAHMDVTLMLAFKENGCKVFTADGDCDLAIAEYTLANNCLGLISQDSDFVIYQPPLCYLSAKHFNFRTLQTKQYDPWRLARYLKTDIKNLPLFASLAGNDFMPYDSLKMFHDKIAYTQNVPYRMRCTIVFSSIISFIHRSSECASFDDQMKSISQSVFQTYDKADLLKDSCNSYILNQQKPKVEKDLSDPWQVILNLLRDTPEYSSWDITRNRKMCYGVVLFDYRTKYFPSPPTVLIELRRKLFGILFYEHNPDQPVTEHIFYGVNNFNLGSVTPILPSVPHPGLLKLLSAPESDYQEERWALFSWVFNVDSLAVKSLPEHLWVPTVALRYLMRHIKDSLLSWELNGMLASAIMLKEYSLEKIVKMEYPVLEKRSLCLQTLFYKTISIVLKIFAVLRVTPLSNISPYYYQDGKLFHTKYLEAKNYKTSLQLCDSNVESHNLLIKIISIVAADN